MAIHALADLDGADPAYDLLLTGVSTAQLNGMPATYSRATLGRRPTIDDRRSTIEKLDCEA